jgi:predicted methyltransferase
VCAATRHPPSKYRLALLQKHPATRHDRVAVTIETVISRWGLGMLSGNQRDFPDMIITIHRHARAIGILAGLSILATWGAVSARAEDAKAPDYEAIVASPDRSDADRQTDQRRQPARMLAFTGVQPGMKVLDMEASAGYSTELLARAVAPDGVVYAQDSATVVERLKDKFDIRAQKPAMKNVVHVVRNFDDPIPPDVSGLDLITFFFAYHDITYMPVDRAEMNRKMFAALKRGGFLIIADHSARSGDGTTVAKTFHRIEESTLRQEIEAAGFKLAAEADFLRHPEDPRDAAISRPQIPVDEFVLKYRKPL